MAPPPDFGTLKVIYLNATSICNKLTELTELLHSDKPDIICITETWLREDTKPAIFNNYTIFRQDRSDRIGGGVLIAIKTCFHVAIVENGQYDDSICECIFADVNLGNGVLRCGVVYRPPNASYDVSCALFEHVQQNLESVNDYIMLGDFNLPDINWSDYSVTSSSIAAQLLTMCGRISAQQLVNFPTHESNILDLVFVSDENMVLSVDPLPPMSTTKHCTICCQLLIYSDKSMNVHIDGKPDFYKADFTLINTYLGTIEWNELFLGSITIEDYWRVFKDVMIWICNNLVPVRHVAKNKPFPWWNENHRKLKRKKEKKWKDYRTRPGAIRRACYLQAAKEYKLACSYSKCQHERKLFQNVPACPRKFYGYIKQNSSVKQSIPCLKDGSDRIAIDSHSKADMLSNHFSSMFTQDDGCLPHVDVTDELSHITHDFECSQCDVIKAIRNVKTNSAPGPDGFGPVFIKSVAARIAHPLCIIFNVSLREGNIPQDWKCAEVVPVFKKGNTQAVVNYRPVSLTSVISKLLERIVRNQINEHMVVNDLIPKNQHGFLSGRSRVTNLINCLDEWTHNFDKTVQTDIIYLDFSRCFDSVSHPKLIHKLSCIGFRGSALAWLRNFLHNRTQQVRVDNVTSHSCDVISGVPQGTILGPTLFICYTFDIVHVVQNSQISLYADDSKIFKGISCIEDCHKLQSDLNAICKWSDKWQLSLNVQKTFVLSVGNVRFRFDYVMYGNEIKHTDSMTDLGIEIQSNLKFSKHCSTISRKAYWSIRNIFLHFCNHTMDFYKKMYTTYVRPILESASEIWSPENLCDIDCIERVQKYFTRRLFMTCNLGHLPYLERLNILKLSSLEERRIRMDLTLFKKLFYMEIHLDTKFYINDNHLRSDGDIATNFCRTNVRKSFWLNRTIKIWNEIGAKNVPPNNFKLYVNNLDCIRFCKGRCLM